MVGGFEQLLQQGMNHGLSKLHRTEVRVPGWALNHVQSKERIWGGVGKNRKNKQKKLGNDTENKSMAPRKNDKQKSRSVWVGEPRPVETPPDRGPGARLGFEPRPKQKENWGIVGKNKKVKRIRKS